MLAPFCHALRVPTRAPRPAPRSALLALAAALAAAAPAAAEPEIVDGIAAQVDGRIVLVSEVMRSVGEREAAMREQGAPDSAIAKLRADALERLIESRLIEGMVEKAELGATDAEVNRTIEDIAKENGLSLEQLYASVVFHGLSVEEYRAQIERDLERRNLLNGMLGSKVEVSDAEIEALYAERFGGQQDQGDSVHVRQILRAFGGAARRDQATACEEALAARERVLAGEAFEEVAAQVSEVAPRDGGDIGWLPVASVAPWMRDALAPLEPGGVSEVVALPFGCAVLQLVDRRELEPVSLEQASPRLYREIWERKLEREYREWMEELRAKSYIDRRGYFAEAARLGSR